MNQQLVAARRRVECNLLHRDFRVEVEQAKAKIKPRAIWDPEKRKVRNASGGPLGIESPDANLANELG
jgi:hypothetical protein